MNEIRQVDAAAMFVPYPHAFTSSVVLHKGFDSYYTPCDDGPIKGHPDWPHRKAQVYDEWRIHHEDNYQSRLDHITVNLTDHLGRLSKGGKDMSEVEPFKTARMFILFAFKSYDKAGSKNHNLAVHAPGWSLVQREVYKTSMDTDPVLVLQQAETLDCALVFTGTNSGADLPASTTSYGTGFCGFEGVHKGYRDELSTITVALWKKVRPTLEQCNKVTCVGHSLGGALCELFAGCANSGHTTDPDFQALAWEKAKNPTRMPSIES